MSRIHCLVVDDEELARSLLENFIGRMPQLHLVDKCKDSLEAVQVLQQHRVDLLFLDIQMPELTGIELLRTLAAKPQVIFTTAYPAYALEGYALDVVDYLLKPFGFERFVQAVNKAAERIRLQQIADPAHTAEAEHTNNRDHLIVKSEHKIHRLRYEDIHYIQSMREYVAFYTPNGRILSLNSLKSLEEELPSDKFVRIHKSYMVAISRIEALEGNQVVIGKEKLPVGANYKEELLKRVF